MTIQRAHGHERKRLAQTATATQPITLEAYRRAVEHLTDHPESCPCGPILEDTGGDLLVLHRPMPDDAE